MIETAQLPSPPPVARAAPRLGFAGVGWIGRHRLEAIVHSGCGEVAALFDPAANALTAAHELAPAAAIARSFDDLLALGLDGLVIATPSALHAEQAMAALHRGQAVFCQKPLGRNADETRATIAAARAADRLLHVDLSYRFTAGMQRIRELIRSGELGRIYAIEAKFHNAYGPDKSWFYDAALSGGGCLLDLGIHLVDLALWAQDFPAVTHVVGHLLNRDATETAPSNRVEDYAAAQVLLSNGASLQLACSWRAPAGEDAAIELTFFGSRGGASFRNVGGSFHDFTAEHFLPDRTRRPLASPPDAWGGRAAVAWCQRLAASPSFDTEIERFVAVAETLDRIYGHIP
jgi:predicted dehydrogenase